MSERSLSGFGVATRLAPGAPRSQSYTRLAIGDGMLALGVVSVLCGALGAADDPRDGAVLIAAGFVLGAIGWTGRRSLDRMHRPPPGRILAGLALTWVVLVALGTGVYLVTGTIDRVDDAVVESAAGFSTTALTTLDAGELSLPMQLWRAGTQWVGGLVGIIVGVVALPLALRGRAMSTASLRRADELLVPTPVVGRRRVAAIYVALTLACGLAYVVTGMGTRNSAVHALTTVSTGGFSTQTDSFVGFGTGPRLVAIVFMAVAGSSYFVLWWLVRGRAATAWQSTELRVYLLLLTAGTLLVLLVTDLDLVEAAFTVVSAASTTGFAVGDWTVLDDGILTVLLLLIATGSMSGSAGGGLRVLRAWTLVGFASRELRRQLDPNSVVVVKQGGQSIDERALERTTGYQIAHLGLCAIAAFVLGAAGVDLLGAIYTGISVVSTHGPGIGTTAFGDLGEFSPEARLALTPFMLAGRMTILPLMLGLSLLFRAEHVVVRWLRRLSRRRR